MLHFFQISEDLHLLLDVDYSRVITFCSKPEDKHRPRVSVMPSAVYQDCKKEGQKYRCPEGPVKMKQSEDKCLDSLMDRHYEGMLTFCRFKPYQGTPMAFQIDQSKHFIYLPQNSSVLTTCTNENKEDEHIMGNGVVDVEFGCHVSTPYFSIYDSTKSNDYLPDLLKIKMMDNLRSLKEALEEKHLDYIRNNKDSLRDGFSIPELYNAANKDWEREGWEPNKNIDGMTFMDFLQWIVMALFTCLFPLALLGNFIRIKLGWCLTKKERLLKEKGKMGGETLNMIVDCYEQYLYKSDEKLGGTADDRYKRHVNSTANLAKVKETVEAYEKRIEAVKREMNGEQSPA